jgi:hypothetical protein
VNHAGRDAIATDGHRSSIVPGSGALPPAANSVALPEAAARQRARHLALLLMAVSAVAVLGFILLLLWRLA